MQQIAQISTEKSKIKNHPKQSMLTVVNGILRNS